MSRSRKIVTPDVLRQRKVLRTRCTDKAGRHAQIPELGRPKGFHYLGTGLSSATSVQQPCGFAGTLRIGPIFPPEDPFAADFVRVDCPVGQSKSEIQRHLAACDMRHGAVPDYFPGFILIESQVYECSDKVSRLRAASADDVVNFSSDWICRSGVVLFRVMKERHEIPCCRKSHSENKRVLRRKHKLVEECRIKTVFQANLRRIGCSRKRRECAIGPGPIGTGNGGRRAAGSINRFLKCG